MSKMFKKIFTLILVVSLIESGYLKNKSSCEVPAGCEINQYHVISQWSATEYISTEEQKGIICTIKNKRIFRFDFDSWLHLNQTEACRKENFKPYLEIKFTTSQNVIFDERFNLQGYVKFFQLFGNYLAFKLSFAKRISADLGFSIDRNSDYYNTSYGSQVVIIRSKLDFYARGKLIKSCQDLVDANLTTPRSIFQMHLTKAEYHMVHCKYRHALCPLMFKNTHIEYLYFHGMNNLFFMRNVLTFTNDTFEDLNSIVEDVLFYSSENLVVDSSLLNPSVFKSVAYISFYEPISKIDNQVLRDFELLVYVQLETTTYRNLINKQGVKWMRALNWFLNVNLSDPTDIKLNQEYKKEIKLRSYYYIPVRKIFPNKDFCLYIEFPFEQLVLFSLLFEVLYFKHLEVYDFNPSDWEKEMSCTAWWLFQYFHILKYVYNNQPENISVNNIPESSVPKSCNFTKMIERCKIKSLDHFRSKLVLDNGSFHNLSMNILFLLQILFYIVPLFGFCTNAFVIYIILRKKNNDLFSGFKQFNYLCLMSLFSIIILIIHLFSWISDCHLLTEIICLNFRRYVWIQFMKVIFKEFLVVMLRFMINFAYVAFAFNRIMLIGKDHPKFVEKIANCTIIKYCLVTGFISLALAFVKVFKYRVNYDRSDRSYPYNIEYDFWTHSSTTQLVYFIFNIISDLLNYFVFVLVCFSIDIYMLVILRRTLKEKLARLKELNGTLSNKNVGTNKQAGPSTKSKNENNSIEKITNDMNAAMNNAIRMVIVNSLINILFKLHLCFYSLNNLFLYVGIYYLSKWKAWRVYENFYYHLCKGFFLITYSDPGDFLYLILISIQLFIYIRFDLKIKAGFKRLFSKSNDKNPNQK